MKFEWLLAVASQNRENIALLDESIHDVHYNLAVEKVERKEQANDLLQRVEQPISEFALGGLWVAAFGLSVTIVGTVMSIWA